MTRLKIAHRLVFAFSLLLAIMAGMGLFSLRQIGEAGTGRPSRLYLAVSHPPG
jgi:methyl-accepting chemotaxis protein